MSLPATLLAGLASLIAPARCPACRAFTSEADTSEADTNEADTNEADTNEADTNEADTNEADTNEADTNEADTNEVGQPSAPRDARGALGALLCLPCRERLEWLEVACLACGLPRGPGLAESRRCSRCRTQSLGRVRTTTGLYRYRGPGRHVLRRLKYEGHDPLGHALGRALGERLRRWRGELLAEELVICPVPLHPWRRLGRGYNQAELIAAGVAAELERPLVPLLRRRRATRALYGVRRHQRDEVLRGAFVAPSAAAGARVLLIDDIRTSGATLRAAGRALHKAGARRIDAAVVAC